MAFKIAIGVLAKSLEHRGYIGVSEILDLRIKTTYRSYLNRS
jgi:hypothetical protein